MHGLLSACNVLPHPLPVKGVLVFLDHSSIYAPICQMPGTVLSILTKAQLSCEIVCDLCTTLLPLLVHLVAWLYLGGSTAGTKVFGKKILMVLLLCIYRTVSGV